MKEIIAIAKVSAAGMASKRNKAHGHCSPFSQELIAAL
jgi:hypothetical protein